MITKFKLFEFKGKMVNVDYKLYHQNWKEEPIALVTDYKINRMENNYIYIISKGYQYVNFGLTNKSKKGWVPFDDFESKEVRKFPKKTVQDGTKRIKVYFDI